MGVIYEVRGLEFVEIQPLLLHPQKEAGKTLSYRDSVVRTQSAFRCQVEQKTLNDAVLCRGSHDEGSRIRNDRKMDRFSGHDESFTVHKIDGSENAEKCPEVIPFPVLAHVENHEGHKDTQSDHFLHDFELSKR